MLETKPRANSISSTALPVYPGTGAGQSDP